MRRVIAATPVLCAVLITTVEAQPMPSRIELSGELVLLGMSIDPPSSFNQVPPHPDDLQANPSAATAGTSIAGRTDWYPGVAAKVSLRAFRMRRVAGSLSYRLILLSGGGDFRQGPGTSSAKYLSGEDAFTFTTARLRPVSQVAAALTWPLSSSSEDGWAVETGARLSWYGLDARSGWDRFDQEEVSEEQSFSGHSAVRPFVRLVRRFGTQQLGLELGPESAGGLSAKAGDEHADVGGWSFSVSLGYGFGR
jgi:hypothetical protein